MNYLDTEGSDGYIDLIVKKVVVIQNHALDWGFVVVILYSDRLMSYWKFGGKAWAPIDTKDYDVNDVVVCNGKCYAVSIKGVLFELDLGFKLKVVRMPRLPRTENYLVEYKSELYVVSKICVDEEGGDGVSFQMKIFKKCKNSWMKIKSLGNEMLISSDDVSVGLSSEDFRGRGANCVYVAQTDSVSYYVRGEGEHLHYGVFRFDEDTTSSRKLVHDPAVYWPPPEWLKKIAQDN